MSTSSPVSAAREDTSAPLEAAMPGPAPRVAVMGSGAGGSVELLPEPNDGPEAWHSRFLMAFGTTEATIAEALFQQLLNALGSGQQLDAATANLALAFLHRIAPKDEIEAMLASQMVVAHTAAMDASRRALHVEQTPGGRQAYLSLGRKLMTLFTAQMDALNRNRGKATVQKVVVERVNLAPGAQAIVGAVANGRRGDGE
jgi:hypothetical protein